MLTKNYKITMIQVIKRNTDNKFLKSVEADTWVDDVKEAYEMSFKECIDAKAALLNTYAENSLIILCDFAKIKPTTREDRQAFLAMIKK